MVDYYVTTRHKRRVMIGDRMETVHLVERRDHLGTDKMFLDKLARSWKDKDRPDYVTYGFHLRIPIYHFRHTCFGMHHFTFPITQTSRHVPPFLVKAGVITQLGRTMATAYSILVLHAEVDDKKTEESLIMLQANIPTMLYEQSQAVNDFGDAVDILYLYFQSKKDRAIGRLMLSEPMSYPFENVIHK